jgi:competence protein ComEC
MPTPSVFTSVINSYLPEPQASLLNGIIFGVNLKTTKVFYEQLKIVGLLHIVVLSGINITLLTVIIGKLTENLGKQLSILLTILIVILFVIFVGPKAPIIRAAFMGILTLVAILYGRKNLVYYSLFLSIILIAIFWPKWLTSISFQLSYSATLGLIIFNKKIHVNSKNVIVRFFNYIKNEFYTSVIAQVFTAPIIFINFKQISIIAPLSNILISWTIVPLMIFGFTTSILGKVNYWLGVIPAYICHGILTYIVFVIETLSKIPGALVQF